jgi:uncharacterized protein YlaN (UPF0358 family)
MKYFLHDTNSFQDEKVTLLFMNFGYEGLGLFYTTLEKLAMQEKPIKTEVLKTQLKVGKKLEKCWNFMQDLEIISSTNGETFNKQLLNYSEKFKKAKEKTKERVSEWREKQAVTKTVTHNKRVRNAPKGIVRYSNVKEIDKEKPQLFKESIFYDKQKFKEALPEWSKDKLKFYFDAAEKWSDESNKKQKDWIRAVKTWASKDEKEGKIIFNKVPKTIFSGVING